MREPLKKVRDAVVLILENAIQYMGAVILTCLFLISIVYTVYFVDGYSETPYYNSGSAILVIIAVIGIAFIYYLFFISGWMQRVNEKKLLLTLMMFAYLFGSMWVMISHSYPVADRDHVSAAAIGFVKGDFSALEVGNYLFIYPYQLFYVAFLEVCYFVMGNGYYFFPQMVNAVAAAFICYHIYGLTKEMFEEKNIRVIVLLLSFGSLALFFFSTYVYGNILGLCFSVWAFKWLMRYFKTHKVQYGVLSAILIAIGSLLKNNFIIFYIAMLITLVLVFLKEKKVLHLIVLLLVLGVRPLFSLGVDSIYEARSGVEISEGQPMIASLAMGLRDDGNAPGWHSGFDINIYRESAFDRDLTSQIAKDSIYGSLSKMKHDLSYGIGFFFEKTVTQWGEPTYQSMWDSNCSNNHTMELSCVAASLYEGGVNRFLVFIMDVFQSLIWGLAFFYFIYHRKGQTASYMMPWLVLIGGFIFQFLGEAKAQYNLQYMIIMIPYAACGMNDLLCLISTRLKREGYRGNAW